MYWNNYTGSCACPENTIFYSKFNVFKCIVCKGKYLVSRFDDDNEAICQCFDDKMVLIISEQN